MNALSLADVTQRLGVARKTVLLLVARGKLQGFKVGQQWRFDPADVDAFVEKQKADVARRTVAAPRPALPPPASRSGSSASVSWKGADRYTH